MEIKNKRFFVYTLGCRTNIVESNIIKNLIIKRGGNITIDKNKADVVIINSCCVTNKADKKTIAELRYFNKLPNQPVIVLIGCYSNMPNNKENIALANVVVGSSNKLECLDVLEKYRSKQLVVLNTTNQRMAKEYCHIITQEKTRAFVKIQDGCNFHCSYCIIPFVRGSQRSLPSDEVIEIIQQAIKKNIKEIILTGVNLAGYYDGKTSFFKLLNMINDLPGDFRVRLSSIEPFQLTKQIIDLITNNKRWCRHLHICLQSANDNVLKKMNRHYKIKDFIKLCDYIRTKDSLISLTTDYIANFPSETKNDFQDSLDNLSIIKFANMHVFPFSPRPTLTIDTTNVITDHEKKQRLSIIKDMNIKNTDCYLQNFINKVVIVIFENNFKNNTQKGHSEFYFSVIVKTNKNLVNHVRRVKILRLINHQLFGELID